MKKVRERVDGRSQRRRRSKSLISFSFSAGSLEMLLSQYPLSIPSGSFLQSSPWCWFRSQSVIVFHDLNSQDTWRAGGWGGESLISQLLYISFSWFSCFFFKRRLRIKTIPFSLFFRRSIMLLYQHDFVSGEGERTCALKRDQRRWRCWWRRRWHSSGDDEDTSHSWSASLLMKLPQDFFDDDDAPAEYLNRPTIFASLSSICLTHRRLKEITQWLHEYISYRPKKSKQLRERSWVTSFQCICVSLMLHLLIHFCLKPLFLCISLLDSVANLIPHLNHHFILIPVLIILSSCLSDSQVFLVLSLTSFISSSFPLLVLLFLYFIPSRYNSLENEMKKKMFSSNIFSKEVHSKKEGNKRLKAVASERDTVLKIENDLIKWKLKRDAR